MKQLEKSNLHSLSIQKLEEELARIRKKTNQKEKLIYNLVVFFYILFHLALLNLNLGKRVHFNRNIENYNFPLLICSIIYLSCRLWKHIENNNALGTIAYTSNLDIIGFIYFILVVNVIYCIIKLCIRHGIFVVMSYTFLV